MTRNRRKAQRRRAHAIRLDQRGAAVAVSPVLVAESKPMLVRVWNRLTRR